MGQVPYGIIGNGRVARHFKHYFDSLQIPWQEGVGSPTLLLITDSAIDQVARTLDASARAVHFSGCVVSDFAYGAHPLYTFADVLYDVSVYPTIPFVVEAEAPQGLLPGLPNRMERIPRSDKALYHALCVLAGNYTTMLWERLYRGFKTELHLSPEIAYPYLQQIAANLQTGVPALTGPLIRGDWDTIHKNLSALEGDPFQKVYQAFVETRGNP